MKLSVEFWAGLFTVPTLGLSQYELFSTFNASIINTAPCPLLNSTGYEFSRPDTLNYIEESSTPDTPTYAGPYNPSHTIGILSDPAPAAFVGPDSAPSTSSNTWTIQVNSNPAGDDTKFLVLHFDQVNLPGNNRLEVDLNYDPPETDVFYAADGADLWTRPINIKPLAGAPVVVRYITDGATTGKVRLAQIGVGQPVDGRCGSRSNSDPFLLTTPYVEPKYDPFWFCAGPPNWENIACITDASDVRARVARSVGMIIGPAHQNTKLSTCSVTLVDTDKVVLAGHCLENKAEGLASSITFDYQTDCDGNRPTGVSPRFFKVKEVMHWVYDSNTGLDYCLLRIVPPPGVPPLQLRPDLPDPYEDVFGVHHPNGAIKKLSVPHPGFVKPLAVTENGITVPKSFHVSGGSSGSALFDTAGRVLGVLSGGDPCGFDTIRCVMTTRRSDLKYYPSSAILKHILDPPAEPPETRDVMIVFDHSGSMSELDSTRRTKIEVARDAVSLFVQLVRKNVGSRVGLVSFSTKATSPVDFAIASVSDANKAVLIGSAPFSGGKVGSLTPGGSTSIGDGLSKAGLQLTPASTNPRAILLMTDGMENTSPLVDSTSVLDAIHGIQVHAVGFGKPGNLNGDLLNKLTSSHGGMYSNAESGVTLQKFFSQAFGNIFEYGILKDPEYDLAASQQVSQPLEFNVCGEDLITVAVGWDNADATLRINLTTPAGQTITGTSSGVEQAVGRAWTFLRVPLPYSSERTGTWNVTVFRPTSEIPVVLRQASEPALHYFINIIPTGGPRLVQVPVTKLYFTGDTINPLVTFNFNDGSWPADATLDLTLSRPNASIGSIISNAGLHAPVEIGGDTIPARQATLRATGVQISASEETFSLSNEPEDTDGLFEETGLYGKVLQEKLVTEGEYTVHVRAKTSGSCVYTRELLWSIHVDVGIDPAHTPVSTIFTGTSPDGQSVGTITLTPRDKYGNALGPGRASSLPVTGATGTTVTGPVKDNGDGTYTVPIRWDPSAGSSPGVIITQPGRPPVVVVQPGVCTPPDTNPAGGKCERCVPYPGQNQCQSTTSCSSTPFGTMCACRPGYRADAKGDATSVHWRLNWPVPGHEHRVYVAPGQLCDTLCDKWFLGAEGCREVAVIAC